MELTTSELEQLPTYWRRTKVAQVVSDPEQMDSYEFTIAGEGSAQKEGLSRTTRSSSSQQTGGE